MTTTSLQGFCSPALYAQIVCAVSNSQSAEISVLYTGRTSDTAEKSEENVNEVWHSERDLRQLDSLWQIVGIQQREEQ